MNLHQFLSRSSFRFSFFDWERSLPFSLLLSSRLVGASKKPPEIIPTLVSNVGPGGPKGLKSQVGEVWWSFPIFWSRRLVGLGRPGGPWPKSRLVKGAEKLIRGDLLGRSQNVSGTPPEHP